MFNEDFGRAKSWASGMKGFFASQLCSCTYTVLGVNNVSSYVSISYADWGWFSMEYQHVTACSDTVTQLLVHKFTGINVC